MEFDKHKKTENLGNSKETKKKKLSKRTPAYVPLPVDKKNPDYTVDQVKKPKPEVEGAKRSKDRAKSETQTQKPAHEIESERAMPEKSTSESASNETVEVVVDERPNTDGEIQPKDTSIQVENEVPLHVQTEGEVFLSDRLRSDTQESAVKTEDVVTGEVPAADDDSAQQSQPKSTLRHNLQRQRKTPAQQQRSTSAASAAAASSPFLAQWRNKNAGGVSPQNPNTISGTPNVPAPPHLPPHNPNVGGFNQDMPSTPNVLPITSQPVAEQVRDRASERRHLLTGLVVGAVVEHIRHKRREKRMEKAHKKEVSGHKKAQATTHIERRAEQQTHVREKTALEKTIDRLEKIIPLAATSTVAERHDKSLATTNETASPERTKAEAPKSIDQAKKEFEERARKAVEVARDPEEEVQIPENHRVEKSTWHAIEVDKKTGKAVENASFGYGEAFQHEQHQEQLRREIDEASADSDEVRKKYQQAKKVDKPAALTYTVPLQLSSGQTKSEAAKERGVQLAKGAAQSLGKVQPIDAVLWFILGIIVLFILRLL